MRIKEKLLKTLPAMSIILSSFFSGIEPAQADDLSLEAILNLTVSSASKFSQKQSEAPSVISVVTRQQIRDYGWFSLNDILYRQPGFVPSKDYDRRTVSSRGIFEG